MMGPVCKFDRTQASGLATYRSLTSPCWYGYPAPPPQCAFTPTPSPMKRLTMRPRLGEWLCRFHFHHPTAAPLDRAEHQSRHYCLQTRQPFDSAKAFPMRTEDVAA